MTAWRLLVDRTPRPGSLNMAIDEVLFHRAAAGRETWLRFYRWARPTASLGASQDAGRVLDAAFCRAGGIDVVRRITGGKLVLHDREVTYAVASADAAAFTASLRDSYRLISQALLRGLELMGLRPDLAGAAPPEYARGTMPCFAFAARDEISLGGLKLVGSAQKRSGAAFLQHGSIPLRHDPAILRAVARPGAAGPAGPGMTSLSEALGREVDFDWAVERLARGFEESFGVAIEPAGLSDADLAGAARLEAERYANDAWTFRIAA